MINRKIIATGLMSASLMGCVLNDKIVYDTAGTVNASLNESRLIYIYGMDGSPGGKHYIQPLCLPPGNQSQVPPVQRQSWEIYAPTGVAIGTSTSAADLAAPFITDSTGTLYGSTAHGPGIGHVSASCYTSSRVIDASVPACDGIGDSGCYRAKVYGHLWKMNPENFRMEVVGNIPLYANDVLTNCIVEQGGTAFGMALQAEAKNGNGTYVCPRVSSLTIYAKNRP